MENKPCSKEVSSLNTVLLTNGLYSKTLAAVRSLGSRGIRTIVAEKNLWHASGLSKYCSRSLVCPDPAKSPETYKDWLLDTIRREKCDVLFIMDDDTMKIAIDNRSELESLCRVPLPPTDSYFIAADKGRTIQLAEQTDVPCPRTAQLQEAELEDPVKLKQLVKDFTYPLVIKPRYSSGARGIRIANNVEELIQTIYLVHKQYPNPIIQEFIPRGDKYDVCLCYDAGHRLKASFVQKQIRNYPLDKGPSTVHESILFPELIEHAKKLLDRLEWFGVADVEFIIDHRNGEPKLLEINPRFWSSVHLSIRCGVDFPWLLYQLALGADVENITQYQTGKLGKATFPGDILHFLSNPNRMKMDPPFWKFLPDDTLSWDDPWPTFGFFLSALRYSVDINTWKLLIRR